MAITKIHHIKSTLNLAIDYITKSEKIDEKILVSSFKCHLSTAHIQFMKTREDNDTKGTVLARNLIQSFTFEEIGAIKKAMSLMLTAFSYILLKVLSEFSFIVLKPLFIASKTPAIIKTNTINIGV